MVYYCYSCLSQIDGRLPTCTPNRPPGAAPQGCGAVRDATHPWLTQTQRDAAQQALLQQAAQPPAAAPQPAAPAPLAIAPVPAPAAPAAAPAPRSVSEIAAGFSDFIRNLTGGTLEAFATALDSDISDMLGTYVQTVMATDPTFTAAQGSAVRCVLGAQLRAFNRPPPASQSASQDIASALVAHKSQDRLSQPLSAVEVSKIKESLPFLQTASDTRVTNAALILSNVLSDEVDWSDPAELPAPLHRAARLLFQWCSAPEKDVRLALAQGAAASICGGKANTMFVSGNNNNNPSPWRNRGGRGNNNNNRGNPQNTGNDGGKPNGGRRWQGGKRR